jgi:hypothetical protein
VKKCAIKGTGLKRKKIPPGNWFPPPDGNRSRLFLSNEKHNFLGISQRAAARALGRLGLADDFIGAHHFVVFVLENVAMPDVAEFISRIYRKRLRNAPV